MKILQEVTEWDTDTPNHIYLIDGVNMVGYIRSGTNVPLYFKKPITFHKKYRTFLELKSLPTPL
jgi:hypothetical protein